ncbi:MAG TPA: hypothetical protein VMV43_12130 [Candidatus Nanopelagicaceae bacterium]|nr:hypothetical protein [Candidatus Nanopelagicaceae bacterium]
MIGNISIAKTLKRDAEGKIEKILIDLQKTTGLYINDMKVDFIDTTIQNGKIDSLPSVKIIIIL